MNLAKNKALFLFGGGPHIPLRDLALGRHDISQEGLRALAQAPLAPQLQRLELNPSGIDEESLRAVAGGFINLRPLSLESRNRVQRVNPLPDLIGNAQEGPLLVIREKLERGEELTPEERQELYDRVGLILGKERRQDQK